jgi:ATP-binding cassette subfamily B protein
MKIKPSNKENKSILNIVLGQWKNIFIAFLLFNLVTIFSLLEPRFYRILIDDYAIAGKSDIFAILKFLGFILLCNIVVVFSSIIRNRIMASTGSTIAENLRSLVYKKLQDLSVDYIMSRKTGELMNRVTGDTRIIRSYIQDQATQGINQLLILLGSCIILFSRNWRMAIFIIVPAPLVGLISYSLREKIRYMHRRQRRQWDKVNSFLQDILRGIQIVKMFGQEDEAIARFKEDSRVFKDITIDNEKKWATIFPFLNFVMKVGTFFVLYYGGALILDEKLKVGELFEFVQYTSMIYGPLQWLSFLPKMTADAATSLSRISEILSEETKVKEHPKAIRHSIEGDISFKNVSFSYSDGNNVLDSISIEVKAGEMIGLVGHSGAGKSTFINLVMRFFDPDSGDIFIDGINLKDISQECFRNQLGVVLQETFLFSDNILDNIRYSKPSATLKEVIKAAKAANAHDFIMSFTDGYDTRVGEYGQRLSGGEKQRISIARAILCNPRILILDEATASVDTETEQKIQEALERIVKGRTTIAIAHRLSTLKNADKLIVINHGKIVEVGSHQDLIKKGGEYSKMVTIQSKINAI